MEQQNDDLTKAQDMLLAVSRQREAAHNECVHLAAALAAAQRKIAELESKLKEQGHEEITTKPNGKDRHAPSPAA